jgi:dTDP-4-amino-4,6-dideoxygalactose transaminase
MSMPEIHGQRKKLATFYIKELSGVKGITCVLHEWMDKVNFSYFPILVEDGFPISRDQLYEHLKKAGIISRRYFYPLISDFPMYQNLPSAGLHKLPVATKAGRQVLCLPIYPELTEVEVDWIVSEIRKCT